MPTEREEGSGGAEDASLRPIRFTCEATLAVPPEEIAGRILDVDRWSDFGGFLVLPGIRAAEFAVRTPEVVGSRILVTNTDGSRHVEEVTEWDPPRRVRLRMGEFSPPLSRLASRFEETWAFERVDSGGTRVARTFELHARSARARPLLRLIALLLEQAVARHLRRMAGTR